MTDRHHVNEREGRVHQTMFFRDTRWFFENVHHHEVHHESQHTSMHQHRETVFVFHILNESFFQRGLHSSPQVVVYLQYPFANISSQYFL